jgi:hypothetical protein
LFPAFTAAAGEKLTTFFGRHAGTEPVFAGAFDAGGVVSGLHVESLKLIEKEGELI